MLQGTINIPSIDYEGLENENLKAVAIDCQMVGCGSDGSLDILARVCLVDEEENIIFHTFVEPQISVTDYRYFFLFFCIVISRISSTHYTDVYVCLCVCL